MTLLLVALGAAVGAPLRYVAAQLYDGRVPWGTLSVNVAGSFLLGAAGGLALTADQLALVGTGFCGGLTTYSAFAVQVHDRGPRVGTLVVLLTVPLALLACACGHALTSL